MPKCDYTLNDSGENEAVHLSIWLKRRHCIRLRFGWFWYFFFFFIISIHNGCRTCSQTIRHVSVVVYIYIRCDGRIYDFWCLHKSMDSRGNGRFNYELNKCWGLWIFFIISLFKSRGGILGVEIPLTRLVSHLLTLYADISNCLTFR